MKRITLAILIMLAGLNTGMAQDKTEVKLNLERLASDELMGRETATEGERIAGDFISGKLTAYGIAPFGDSGTFFQHFPVNFTSFDASSLVFLTSGDVQNILTLGDNFILSLRYRSSGQIIQPKPIVFAGYGISAPEYNYDDYKDIDVKDKIVFVLDDEPVSTDTAYFKGEKNTRYSFWGTKYRNAISKGAAGIIVLFDETSGAPWETLVKSSLDTSIRMNRASSSSPSIPLVTINDASLKILLNNESISYEDFMKMKNEGKIPAPFALNKTFSHEIKINSEEHTARNIVGIIEGTDPVLKNEYVVLSAHYDHLGIKNGQIYNGADDNASGTVTVMETARRLAKSHSNKRSIIILLVTGEEEGLYGSEYFSEAVPYIKSISGDINIDMVGREHIDTIYSIGSGRLSTELYEMEEEVNSQTSKFVLDYKFDTDDDPNRFYERSDHYNFAKKNIPVTFLFDNMDIDYHKPTDDADKINYDKIIKVSNLIYDLALRVANLDHKLKIDVK